MIDILLYLFGAIGGYCLGQAYNTYIKHKKTNQELKEDAEYQKTHHSKEMDKAFVEMREKIIKGERI